MRTRRGIPEAVEAAVCLEGMRKRNRDTGGDSALEGRELILVGCRWRRQRVQAKEESDLFDSLSDDLVLCILSKLVSTAARPSDFISVLSTCKRFNGLGHQPLVLSRASSRTFAVRARNWSDSAYRFLKLCVDAGNIEACYTLGMIRFYCLQNRRGGSSLMAQAAIKSHALSLYSLAVIQFNGSGGTKNDKDLRAGVALCARAALLGHIDALRELGHCLQDGYGVRQNVTEGRRFLVQANARELAAVLSTTDAASLLAWTQRGGSGSGSERLRQDGGPGYSLLSDFGCNLPAPEPHPANKFLLEWFAHRGGPDGYGTRLCSHAGCGRAETRKHEFRRCSVCGTVNYCSRACQALDWKLRHKVNCVPLVRWDGEMNVDAGEAHHDQAIQAS
ncbi:hypothetical protein SAY86_001949 [Trapa natans]|uniref:MYND-type domain-containing protein n=1 Tax=Trapa natans TaxID=22666 RepID=A0AAN7LPS7_TRANT|nr:hypothetical protein SAY86_001949 [Trapa natans]